MSHQSKGAVTRISEARVPTIWGEFRAVVYRSPDNIEHVAFVKGHVRGKQDVLVRVHSECLTGDIFRSLRCDCGSQLELAMERIGQENEGVFVYLRGHEGRGIGLGNKVQAYSLQDMGRDTVQANIELGFAPDQREYVVGANILLDLGVSTVRLMTNNPAKYEGLQSQGIKVSERIPLLPPPTHENRKYLTTKRDRLGHILPDDYLS